MIGPLVSVIIPTYNAAKYITAAVDSALGQTYKNFEIIVVDDGSTDNTVAIIEPFRDRIRYIKKSNGGPASARNAGIKVAQGEFIAFLDGDDFWEANKLAQQIALLERHPYQGMVFCDTQSLDNDTTHMIAHPGKTIPNDINFLTLFQKNIIATSSVLVKKICFDKVGLFDEDKGIISVEDYDMWLRIAADFPIAYINQPLTVYRTHSQGISRNIARSYEAEEKVIQKNIERFKERFPQIIKLTPRRLAQLYDECGSDYFYNDDIKQAHQQFSKSLKYRFAVKTFLFYLLSFFTPRAIQIVKRIKKFLIGAS